MMIHILDWFFFVGIAVYVFSMLALLYGLQHPSQATNQQELSVSVVVAARDESEKLPDLIRNLAAQTYSNYEVIIVDDRSSDDTGEIVRRAVKRYGGCFKLIEQGSVTAGESPKKSALQKGIEASGGEIVLLTDADCRVQSGWVAGIVKCFAPDVVMVLGYSEIVSANEAKTWRTRLFENWQSFEFATLVANMAASANLGSPFGASGHNLAFRRAAFDTVGGYKSVMNRVAGDDMLMLSLIRQAGLGRIVYADDKDTMNSSYVLSSWSKFRQQRARWASSGTHHFGADKLFMLYAIGGLAVNMLAMFGAMWAWADWIGWGTWASCVLLKFTVDALFYTAALRRFNRLSWAGYLPLWFVTQPLYLLAMAWWGQRGVFQWKGTTVNAKRPVKTP